MFIRLFKSNYTTLIGILFFLSILLHVDVFNYSLIAGFTKPVTPLYYFIDNWFALKGFNLIIAFILSFSQVILINKIASDFSLLPQKNYLTALVFLLLNCFYPSFFFINPVSVTNLFLLIILYQLFMIYETPEDYEKIFGIGFLIAIASMLYFPSIYFFLVVWIGFLIYRLFDWRAWIISLAGVATPYIFLFVYYFWFDELKGKLLNYQEYFIQWNSINFPHDIFLRIVLILFGGLTIVSLIRYNSTASDKVIRLRGINSILIWLFVLSLFSFFIFGIQKDLQIVFLFVPASVFIANFLYVFKKQFISDIILILMFIGVLISKFYF